MEDYGRRESDKKVYELETRITRIEEKQNNLADDVAEIKGIIGYVATKVDVEQLRSFFETRDTYWTKNLWWLVKAFAVIMGLIVLATFGIERIPTILG